MKTLLVNSLGKWRKIMCVGNSELGELDIKRSVCQGDSLSPLVFVLVLVPLSLILRRAKTAYGFSGSRGKINPQFMDDLKLYSGNEKGLDSLVQTIHVFSQDIEMDFVIETCAMLVIEEGKIVKYLAWRCQILKLSSHYRKVKIIS